MDSAAQEPETQQETPQQDDAEAAKRPKELSRGFEAIARQELRRARRLVQDGQPTPEASFAVSIASVLATLDLASAIREHKEGGA